MASSALRVHAFPGPAGNIEALWKEPEGEPRGSAVVAHAHPLHGGTMHFKVIYRMSRALSRAGFGVLRFNFRGVGGSAGKHDEGRGERDDFRIALDEAQRLGGVPQIAAGFSFGSTVALSVGAEDPRVIALIGAGVPLARWKFDGIGKVSKPTILISGSEDEFRHNNLERGWPEAGGEAGSLEAAALPHFSNVTVGILHGADHFFTGRLDEFEAIVGGFAAKFAAKMVR